MIMTTAINDNSFNDFWPRTERISEATRAPRIEKMTEGRKKYLLTLSIVRVPDKGLTQPKTCNSANL